MSWKTFSKSVIGFSHLKKNTVMQDYSAHFDNGKFRIIAVSDGHGSSNCFRSDRGSKLAVQACLEGLLELAKHYNTFEEMRYPMPEEILRQFCIGILTKWNQLISEDLQANPVDLKELEMCDPKWSEHYKKSESLNHIYGSTLICALMIEDIVLVLHQGDGRCIIFNQFADFYQPVPWDDRCYSNITTSLCDDDVINSIRIYQKKIKSESEIIALFVASDGIEDSYHSEASMYNFYRRLLFKLMDNESDSEFQVYFDEELKTISEHGSGDDMSVAGMVDLDKISTLKPLMEIEIQRTLNKEVIIRTNERMESMENKRDYLRAKLDETEKKLYKLQSENLKGETEFNELKTQLKLSTNEKKSYEESIEALEKHLQDILKTIEKNEMFLSFYENECLLQKKKHDSLVRRARDAALFSDCIDEISTLSGVKKCTKDLESLQAKRGEIISSLSKNRAELKDIKNQISRAKKRVLYYQKEIADLQQKKSMQKGYLRQTKDKLNHQRSEFRMIRQEFDDYEKKYKELNKEHSKALVYNPEISDGTDLKTEM